MKIFDRIITALIGLSIVPISIFTPLINWVYYSPLFPMFIENDTGYTEDFVSIYWLYSRYQSMGLGGKIDLSQMNDSVKALINPAIVTIIFFVLAIVIGISIAITAFFGSPKKTQMCLSISGIISMIGMKMSFNRISEPITAGKVTLGSLLDVWWASFVANIKEFRLTTSYYLIIISFIFILVWSSAYYITLPKNERSRKLK